MAFARRVFRIAGIYGLIVLLPQYFLEQRISIDTPPALTHAEFFYGFLGAAVAFQLVFLLVARDPLRYRAAMIPAIVEKASFGIATVVLFLQQRLPAMTLGFGAIDLLLGVLFAVAYIRTASSAAP